MSPAIIPIYDSNPTRRVPFVTVGLIILNAIVFVQMISLGGDSEAMFRFVYQWGAIPSALTEAVDSGRYFGPEMMTMFTSMFVHGGWMHILGNMLYLWIFGNNIEDRIGSAGFLIFYLAAGLVGASAHAWADPLSTVPMVGASGAVAGVLGAYLVLYPGASVVTLVLFRTMAMPAALVLGIWFAFQLLAGFSTTGVAAGAEGGVAWFAHIGGFIFGIFLGVLARTTGGEDAESGPKPGPYYD